VEHCLFIYILFVFSFGHCFVCVFDLWLLINHVGIFRLKVYIQVVAMSGENTVISIVYTCTQK